jgi:hypothetical protein
MIKVWIRGRLLGQFSKDDKALEHLECIVKKAEYTIIKREEDGKEIWII